MGIRGEYIFFSCFYRSHKQAPARISSTKTVLIDKELVTPIELLNTLKGIQTTECCQGNKIEYASIFIKCVDDVFNKGSYLFTFACKLAQILADNYDKSNSLISPAYEIDLSINWYGEKKKPFLLLRFPSEFIELVTNAFVLEKSRLQHDIEGILQSPSPMWVA